MRGFLSTDEYGTSRKRAVTMSQTPDDAIRQLVEQFGHTPMNIRLELTKKILEYGGQAVPVLIEGLQHPIWSVRQDCANALAELKAVVAVPALITALHDTEPGVRYESARALGRIATPEAAAALQAAIETADDDDFRYHLYDCRQGKA